MIPDLMGSLTQPGYQTVLGRWYSIGDDDYADHHPLAPALCDDASLPTLLRIHVSLCGLQNNIHLGIAVLLQSILATGIITMNHPEYPDTARHIHTFLSVRQSTTVPRAQRGCCHVLRIYLCLTHGPTWGQSRSGGLPIRSSPSSTDMQARYCTLTLVLTFDDQLRPVQLPA